MWLQQVLQMFSLPSRRLGFWRTAFRLLIGSFISLTLLGCVNRAQSVRVLKLPDIPDNDEVRRLNGSLSEVAPPAIFSDLNDLFRDAQPQVAIAYPKPNQVIETTTLAIKISLRDLSIYKDEKLELGPHLQVSLDNQPAQSIYDLEAPIEFLDLTPGSHTLRVFAVKPWGESFKNEAAYTQTIFHVFAQTDENAPDPNKPQLIYSEPQGTYGAQPILLDFYLNNAPLHLIAAESPDVTDWKVRCDVNGQSFVFDQWQPIYLKGFKPGQNWVQITLIDEQANPINNAFNSTVRLVNYDPEQRDTLAKLVRGELPLAEAGKIVDPNYEPPVEPAVELPAETIEENLPTMAEPNAGESQSVDTNEPTVNEKTDEKESIYDEEQIGTPSLENGDVFDSLEKEQSDGPANRADGTTAPSLSGENDDSESFSKFAAERLEDERLEAEELAKDLKAEESAIEALEKIEKAEEISPFEQSPKTVEESVENALEEVTDDLEDIKESTEDRLEETIDNLEESANSLLEDKTADFKESVEDLKAAIEQRSPTDPIRAKKSSPAEPRANFFERFKAALQQLKSPPPTAAEPSLSPPPSEPSSPLQKLTIPELSDNIQL